MSYHTAFRLGDAHSTHLFMRCHDCACIVAEMDTATHDAWHEWEEERILTAVRTLLGESK